MTRTAKILAALAFLALSACGGQPPSNEDDAVGRYNVPREQSGMDVMSRTSALWTGYNYGPYVFVVGTVNNTVAQPGRYVCGSSPGYYWHEYTSFSQGYNPTPIPGPNWTTTVTGSSAYIASDPTIALSTLTCPPLSMDWSESYGVLYNKYAVNCTVKGHAPNAATKSLTVNLPAAGLQFTPGTNAYLPYWTVAYSAPGPYIDGTGYCGAVTRVFGS